LVLYFNKNNIASILIKLKYAPRYYKAQKLLTAFKKKKIKHQCISKNSHHRNLSRVLLNNCYLFKILIHIFYFSGQPKKRNITLDSV